MRRSHAEFELLKHYRRQNRTHVYLLVGPGSVTDALTCFERHFKMKATLVNLTPENCTVQRLRESVGKHGCCVFYIQGRQPDTLRELRELLWAKGYPEAMLETVNKVYRFASAFDQYALAA